MNEDISYQLAHLVNSGEMKPSDAWRIFSQARAREAWLDLPAAERKRLLATHKRLKEFLDNITE